MAADALALTPVPDRPERWLVPVGDGRSRSSTPMVPAAARAGRPDPLSGPVPQTGHAVIGNALRMPAAWCEMTPCISRHADPEALGEADARARAITDGWREDALGRLACPRCQQTRSTFRGTRPVMRWERDTALTMSALMVAAWQERLSPAAWGREETAVMPVLPASVLPAPPPPA